ncbi:RNA methyltransferase [Brackiella oedipodis]|uniref:RNA methyltransferase n=1 Tax=Brackiella oedipodis TaxID=124225 RepID=UPI000570583D|nr:RNA methyltransferase [Brackiella oedipodis]
MPVFQDFAARCRFIMTQPSHPGNVGSACRALKTMGFTQLCLTAPRTPNILVHEDAIALAKSAQDVLQQTQVLDRLDAALAPVTLSFALTARHRDMGPTALNIRQAAELAQAHLTQHEQHQVAIVLGNERSGLSNQEVSLCHYICHIPANPEYSSLNVAQALQLAAWELRYALAESAPAPAAAEQPLLATQAQTEALLAHWQEALEAIGFLDPQHPKKLMLRMRYWLTRSHMSQEENQMLRGVCKQIIQSQKKL